MVKEKTHSTRQQTTTTTNYDQDSLTEIIEKLNALTTKVETMDTDIKTQLKKNNEKITENNEEMKNISKKIEEVEDDVEKNKEEIRNIKLNMHKNINSALKTDEATKTIQGKITRQTREMQDKIKELETQNIYLSNIEHMKKRILTSTKKIIKETDDIRNLDIMRKNGG